MEQIPGEFPVKKEEELDYEELDRQMHEEYAKVLRERRRQQQTAAETEQEDEELIDGRMELFSGGPEERDKQCRICLGGEEDEPELGRLISPCMCDGSMRYVHVKCIEQWRTQGTHNNSYIQCPQCRHKYHLRRTFLASIVTSPPVLLSFTFILLLMALLISGQFMHLIISRFPSTVNPDPTPSYSPWSIGSYGVGYGYGDFYVGDVSSTTAFDIIRGAVQTFDDGSALRVFDRFTSIFSRAPTTLPRPIRAIARRLSLGFSFLGSLSFLNLVIVNSLFMPLQLLNHFRGTFRARRRQDRQPGDPVTWLFVIAVLVGIVRAVGQLYGVSERLSLAMLRYVEKRVLEVDNLRERERERVRRGSWLDRLRRRWLLVRIWIWSCWVDLKRRVWR